MIYFSELKDKKVVTEDYLEIGEVEDLIFLVSEKPLITKIVIRDKKGAKTIIPASYIQRSDNKIHIKKDYQTAQLEENELFVLRDLQDKQIIDIVGNKIVRVNDIAIQEKGQAYIVGVDVGILGILRWLKIEGTINKILAKINFQLTSRFLSWSDIQPLELARGHIKLKQKEDKLSKIRPEDLADHLEKTNVINARKLLGILDKKFAANVIRSLNINYQTSLFKYFRSDKAAEFINLLDPDDVVDVLLTLSQKKQDSIFQLLSSSKRHELLNLMQLSHKPIGDLMTTETISVKPEQTVRSVIEKISKETIDFATVLSIYVVNAQNQLVGVFNLHELLLHDPDTPVYKFMIQNVIVAHITTPAEIILKKMIKYRIGTIPIINNDKQIIGMVTIADAAEKVLDLK